MEFEPIRCAEPKRVDHLAGLGVVLFPMDPIEYLPTAVLGAVIVSAAVGLSEPAPFRGPWATSRFEFALALVGAIGVA